MQNLRDKLLKAGLVSDEDAKRAETPAPRPNRSDRPRDERPRDDRGRENRAQGARPGGPPGRGHGGHGHAGRGQGGHSHGGHAAGHSHGGQAHAGHAHGAPRAEAGPRIPKLPPLPGSREYQRLESRKQLELDRKLFDLAKTNDIPVEAGAQTFYFVTRKGRLRRLELSPEQAGKLERGELAIVERREPSQIEHSLVAPQIAEQMRALSEKAVRFLNTPGAAVGFLSDTELEAKKKEEAELGPETADVPESAEAAAEGAGVEDAGAVEGSVEPGEAAPPSDATGTSATDSPEPTTT